MYVHGTKYLHQLSKSIWDDLSEGLKLCGRKSNFPIMYFDYNIPTYIEIIFNFPLFERFTKARSGKKSRKG